MISSDLPYLHEITVALRECEYVVANDREIAALYCSDSEELDALFRYNGESAAAEGSVCGRAGFRVCPTNAG